MWNYIIQLNKEKKITVFMTTHYLEEADSFCDRIPIMDHGKIKVSGTPGELKEKLGGDVLEIDITDGSTLVDLFSSIPGVTEVKQNGSVYRIKLPRAEKALPAIFDSIYAKGLKVNNVSFTKPTLDQVFLEVTAGL